MQISDTISKQVSSLLLKLSNEVVCFQLEITGIIKINKIIFCNRDKLIN